MAIIYDFPTNYEEKLEEVEILLEKKYVDQAICTLEDWLQNTKGINEDIKKEMQKKLFSCYLLKKEFEECEELILHLKKSKKIDLTLVAYDVVLSLVQNKFDEAEEKKIKYQKEISPFAYKNVLELISQLKTFYEEEWLFELTKLINRLLESDNFERSLSILSQLQEIDEKNFNFYENEFKVFFEKTQNKILKTLLFELLIQKNQNIELTFINKEDVILLMTEKKQLDALYELLKITKEKISQLGLDEITIQMLEQQMFMFYQYMFPFYDKINFEIAILEICYHVMGINLKEKEKNLLEATIADDKKANTRHEINGYMLTLSLLM